MIKTIYCTKKEGFELEAACALDSENNFSSYSGNGTHLAIFVNDYYVGRLALPIPDNSPLWFWYLSDW